MTPTPPSLAQIIVQEITAEVGNALEPEDRKRFCEHIEKHIIQRRIEPLVRVAEAAKELSEKCYCSDFPGLNPCPRCRVIEALSKL